MVRLNCKESNGYIMYLGMNNWHVEDSLGRQRIMPREFDSYEDARSYFSLLTYDGNLRA